MSDDLRPCGHPLGHSAACYACMEVEYEASPRQRLRHFEALANPNPTPPLPIQEPAGAVEALKLVEKIKNHADECADQAWHAGECNERVGTPYFESLRLFNQALDQLAALASLPPVTQAKLEPAWWTFKSITGGQVFYEGPTRPEGAPERAEPLYAAPQEAVERQPLMAMQARHVWQQWTAEGHVQCDWLSLLRLTERAHGIGPATQEKQR